MITCFRPCALRPPSTESMISPSPRCRASTSSLPRNKNLQHTFLPFTSCSKVHLRFPRPQPEAERAAERHYPRTLSAASHSDEVPEEGESVPRVFLGSLAWAPIGDGNSGYRRLCVKMAGRSKVIAARAGLGEKLSRYMPTTQPRRWYHRGTSPVNVFATGSERARSWNTPMPPASCPWQRLRERCKPSLYGDRPGSVAVRQRGHADDPQLSRRPDRQHDPAADQITGIQVYSCAGTCVQWTTGEFATSKVWFGARSGVYMQGVADPLFGSAASLSAPGPGDVAGKMPALLGEAPRKVHGASDLVVGRDHHLDMGSPR